LSWITVAGIAVDAEVTVVERADRVAVAALDRPDAVAQRLLGAAHQPVAHGDV